MKAFILAVALSCASVVLSAQQGTAAQDGFVPVNGPVAAQDSIPAPRLVGAAYGFIWVVLFGYVWSIRARLGRVEREMAALEQRAAAGGRRP